MFWPLEVLEVRITEGELDQTNFIKDLAREAFIHCHFVLYLPFHIPFIVTGTCHYFNTPGTWIQKCPIQFYFFLKEINQKTTCQSEVVLSTVILSQPIHEIEAKVLGLIFQVFFCP